MLNATFVTPQNVKPQDLYPPNLAVDRSQATPDDDEREREIVAELRDHYTEWMACDSEWLNNADREEDFLAGNTWMDDAGVDRRKALQAAGRSAVSIDLLGPSIDLVINQIRINKLSANFVPLSEGADKETADIRQGLYRNIERVSKAAIARETAYQMAVSVGRGYWRVAIEDEDGPTFLRRLSIKRISNRHAVAIDGTGADFDYADANWAFIYEDVDRQQHREEYGKDAPVDVAGLMLDDQSRALWFPNGKVRRGEYFRRVWKKRTVVQLLDGSEYWADEVPEGAPPAVRKKQKLDNYLEWRLMTGTQVLEKRIWPGKLIPLIVCIGREQFRGRKPKIHTGLVRAAMDPVRMHDYLQSRMMDEVALSPLPHMMAEEGQFSPSQELIANDINRHPWSVLKYKALDVGGKLINPPAWVSPSPNIAAVVTAAQASKDNLERVLNTYAPQRGSLVGVPSGIAAQQVKDQSDVSHAAFPDNFKRALYYEALVVNELMDFVYTEPQAITITKPDDKTDLVLINQDHVNAKGKNAKYLFGGDAKYGVAPVFEPSYNNRMTESADRLLELAKAFPAQIANALDLIIQDLNIPGASKYIPRLRPAGVGGDDDADVGQMQAQLHKYEQNAQQADQIIQQLMAKVEELGSQEALKRFDITSKERIAARDNLTQLIIAAEKGNQQAAQSILDARLGYLSTVLASLAQPEEQPEESAEPASVPSGGGLQSGLQPPTPAAPSTPAVGVTPQ